MDKVLLEFLKTDGLLVAGTILIGFGMQLFPLNEYLFSLLFILSGAFVIFLRTLRKVEKHGKGKK